MSSQVKIIQPSPDMCRFTDTAFDRVIGTDVPLMFDGQPSGTCRILEAEVIEGGYAVRLVVEVPDGTIASGVALPSFTFERNRDHD